MHHRCFNATGVLILDEVTPVIRALFGKLNLKEDHPGPGHASFARLAEAHGTPSMDIHSGLAVQARQLELPYSEVAHPTTADLLELLAEHFGAADDELLRWYLDAHEVEQAADLDVLFVIATRFDDGHGLQSIKQESTWFNSEPDGFEFGGDACYVSREIVLTDASTATIDFGQHLCAALVRNDLDQAHRLLHCRVNGLLMSIQNRTARQALAQRLLGALAQLSG